MVIIGIIATMSAPNLEQLGLNTHAINKIIESSCDIEPIVQGDKTQIGHENIELALFQLCFLAGKHDLDFDALLNCFRCLLEHGTFTFYNLRSISDEMASIVVNYHRVCDKLYTVTTVTCDSTSGIVGFTAEYDDRNTHVRFSHFSKQCVCITMPCIVLHGNIVSHGNAIYDALMQSKINRAKSARN